MNRTIQLLLAGFLGAGACLGMITFAAEPQQAEDDSKAEAEPFSYALSLKGTATIEDAYRVFAAMAVEHHRCSPANNPIVKIAANAPSFPCPGDPEEMTFAQLKVWLEQLCVIDKDWDFTGNECLQRDVLAYMACSYLGCRPGVVTGMFGMTRRYAHREMLFRGIIAPGAPATKVSGSELLSVATRVSRRVQSHSDVQLKDNQIH